MLAVVELKKLHRYLFRTQLNRIFHLLRRDDPDSVAADDMENLEHLSRERNIFQRLAKVPRRFKTIIRHTKCVFNQCGC